MTYSQSQDAKFALEEFRSYLALLARLKVPGDVRARLDLSGIVQQTLFEAHRSADEFAGRTREEKAGWLKRILENNLTDELRKINTARRDFTREQAIDETLERSAVRCLEALAADQTSASMRFERGEQLLLMARAIAELPESQRTAVEMHHLLELPLVEIAERLNCSKPAVAGLLRRGMKTLRARLIEIEEADA